MGKCAYNLILFYFIKLKRDLLKNLKSQMVPSGTEGAIWSVLNTTEL